MIKTLFFLAFAACLGATQPLQMTSSKLTQTTLKMLIENFHCDTFIETGTYRAKTTRMAAPLFKEIHTIELGEALYKRAKRKLRRKHHVYCYLGDSAKVLPGVVKQNKNKNLLIFLDAHWSKADTVRGDKDTPIEAELTAIEKIHPEHMIILIDDIRDFVGTPNSLVGHGGYPLLWDLVAGVKKHFPAYDFWLIGDTGLFCPSNPPVKVSPLVRVSTTSRLYNAKTDDPHSIIQAEKTFIKNAHSKESNNILALQFKFKSRDFPIRSTYFNMWSGLICMGRAELAKSCKYFTLAINNGFPDWRARFYRSQVALLMGNKALAAKDIAFIAKKYPNIGFNKLLKDR